MNRIMLLSFLGKTIYIYQSLGAFWSKIQLTQGQRISCGPYGSTTEASICSKLKVLVWISDQEQDSCQIACRGKILYQNLPSLEKFGDRLYQPFEELLPVGEGSSFLENISDQQPITHHSFRLDFGNYCQKIQWEAKLYSLSNWQTIIYLKISDHLTPASESDHLSYLYTLLE